MAVDGLFDMPAYYAYYSVSLSLPGWLKQCSKMSNPDAMAPGTFSE